MPSRRREIAFSRIVDLSQDIGPGTQMFPAYPRPSMIPWTTREVHGFLAEALFLVSHTGTHIDAPWHFEPRGKKIHELPLERFLAPGHVLDLRNGRAKARISPSQLRAARVSLGRPIRKGDAVLLWTGWERLRGRRAYLFDNPGLSRSAAEELVGWGLSLVGIDTANIDHPSAGELSCAPYAPPIRCPRDGERREPCEGGIAPLPSRCVPAQAGRHNRLPCPSRRPRGV